MRKFQLVIVVLSMAAIGASYAWSVVSVVLTSMGHRCEASALQAFCSLVLGIGIGCAISGFSVHATGYRRTIQVGLAIWGVASLGALEGLVHFSQAGFMLLEAFGGIGVGIAYMALVAFLRASINNASVLSSGIGPLGFATGTVCFSLAVWLRFGSLVNQEVYLGLGLLSLILIPAVLLIQEPKAQPSAKHFLDSVRTKQFWSVWLLLAANVAPGMAFVAVAADWVAASQHNTPRHAVLTFCAAVPFLFLGQVVWARVASRLGERIAFKAMFGIRFALFGFAAFLIPVVNPWAVLAILLSCHGGGFGLVPRIVSRSIPGSDGRALGLILTAWGVGGAAGIWLLTSLRDSHDLTNGMKWLSLLMAIGVFLSSTATLSNRPPKTFLP